jgi:UDP-glucuronate 4-epimerase
VSHQPLKGSRILVTGAAGFIGFHLAKKLARDGATVAGVDNVNSYYDVSLKRARLRELSALPDFEFLESDIADFDGFQTLFAKIAPDVVVHLAAQAGVRYSILNPRAYIDANIDGFLSILEACRARPVRHLIYASSSSVYGANVKVPFSEDDPVNAPVSLYAATKRANELMAQTYAHLFAVPASGLRFFTVYGPWGRPDMSYYLFTKAITGGAPIDVFNHGQLQRDFTYIDDVTEALARLVLAPPDVAARVAGMAPTAPHIIYNVGNHTPVALEEFIATLERIIGTEAKQRYIGMQPGDVPRTFADVDRLAKVTGFRPATTIDAGLAKFVDWYRAYHGRS